MTTAVEQALTSPAASSFALIRAGLTRVVDTRSILEVGLTIAFLAAVLSQFLHVTPPPLPEWQDVSSALASARQAVDRSDYKAARATYTSAFEIAHAVGDTNEQAAALRGVGTMNRLLGNTGVAEEQLESALRLFRTTNDLDNRRTHETEAEILTALGAFEAQVGKVDLARQRLGEALAAYEYASGGGVPTVDDVSHQVSVLLWLAALDIEERNIDAARRLIAWADSRCARRCPNQADLLQVSGDLALAQQHYRIALQAYERALILYHDDVLEQANVLSGLGDALWHLGKTDEARLDYDAALVRSPEPLSRANVLVGRGELETAAGNYDFAARLLTDADAIYTQLDTPTGRAEVVLARGRLLERTAGREQALESYRAAERTYSSLHLRHKATAALTLVSAASRRTSEARLSR